MKHQPYLTIIIVILATGGFFSGIIAWLFLPDMLTVELRNYMVNQIQNIGSVFNLSDSIKTVLYANIIDLLRIYLCGMCLVGFPIIVLFIFLKCFSIGFSFCFLLQHSMIVCFTRILYLPLLCTSAVIGCRFALLLVQNQIDSPIRRLLNYTIMFAGILICILFASGLDGLSSYYYFTQQ